MDLTLKREERATTSSGTFIAADTKRLVEVVISSRQQQQAATETRQALLHALSKRLLQSTRDADVFEKGLLALPSFYTLVAGTDCKKAFDNARTRGRTDEEDGPAGLPELAALLKQAAEPSRDFKGARGRRLGDPALLVAHFALALPSALRRHALADAAVRRALMAFLKSANSGKDEGGTAAAAACGKDTGGSPISMETCELVRSALDSIGHVCTRILSRTERAERALKLFFLEVLGGST